MMKYLVGIIVLCVIVLLLINMFPVEDEIVIPPERVERPVEEMISPPERTGKPMNESEIIKIEDSS